MWLIDVGFTSLISVADIMSPRELCGLVSTRYLNTVIGGYGKEPPSGIRG
jgi:hypothetical protein